MRTIFGTDGADSITISNPAVFDWVPDLGQSGSAYLRWYLSGEEERWTYEGKGTGSMSFDGKTLEQGFTGQPLGWMDVYGIGPNHLDSVYIYNEGAWDWDPADGALSGWSYAYTGNPYAWGLVGGDVIQVDGVGPAPSTPEDMWYSFTHVDRGRWVPRAEAAFVSAGAGDDTVLGGYGTLTADGGDGNDTLTARWGAATLLGGRGNDVLAGGTGRAVLDGGDGRDRLVLGSGGGLADGGLGDDTLVAGGGDQVLTGGAGRDSFVIGTATGRVTITDFRLGRDSLLLDGWGAEGEPAPLVTSDHAGGSVLTLAGGPTVMLLGIPPDVAAGLFTPLA
ncbi:hypothetical protein HHL28_10925 [Aerophototrophica crusticola]|uniref:Calcium-binding protein n=1 Tax=Aerophototrophica crusticola TaxID=1709002 RepID=A0A858R7Y3_9PROT|nr:hypothetical protein HHL28_10925 [Rhodospirillaceae bacterium B3]